ncbi:MAG: HEAT repeat domain-containing protein [Armatimonadetes bacterium]|nr:HEAT repeat domain-containing protein [Armatimonadota bacterium]
MSQRLENRWSRLVRFAKRYPLATLVVAVNAVILLTQGIEPVGVICSLVSIALLLWFVLMFSPTVRFRHLGWRLGDPDEGKRMQAFEQLLQKGDEATRVFVRILKEAPYESSKVWKSVHAHCLAAEGLGRLKAKEGVDALMEALKSPFPEVVATAIWALAQIGDERAVKAIVPLITSKSAVKRQKWLNDWTKDVLIGNGQFVPPLPIPDTIGAVASAALVQLGQAGLVGSFWKAWLKRDENAIKQLKVMKEFRKEITEALVTMLNFGSVSEAINAAELIGDLWAFDALPALKSKAMTLSTPERVRKVCLEVADKLDQLSRLPMPATATEIDTSTLPRPASATEIATDTLPSPAKLPRNSDVVGDKEQGTS